MFGHALIATEDKDHFEEAEQVLRASVARDRYNPFAWYQLGMVYAARGDLPHAPRQRGTTGDEPPVRDGAARAGGGGGPAERIAGLAARAGCRVARALLEQQMDKR